jgi:hypothetical protein
LVALVGVVSRCFAGLLRSRPVVSFGPRGDHGDMTSQARETAHDDRPQHTPGAGRRLLAERLGRELPDLTEDERRDLLVKAAAAREAARRYYGREPASL